MEKMVQKICLDSDLFIELLRGKNEAYDTIKSYDAEFYITSVNLFEIWYGKKKTEPIEEALMWINIMAFDKEASIKAAEIMLALKKEGKLIEQRDIFIAAICIIRDLALLTYNNKHFQRMERFGLKLL